MSETQLPKLPSEHRLKYWKSVDALFEKGEGFAADPNRPVMPDAEFESSPTREGESDGTDGSSRREFMKIMGASLALVGASACTRRPVENVVPYLNKPVSLTPGVPNWYASTCGECDSGCGVLVKTREGRPIKFEGNPEHPVNQGGLCARGQASVLNLYDADRLHVPVTPGRKGTLTTSMWPDFDSKVVAKLSDVKAKGGKIRVLTGELSSPSTNKLIAEFLAGFGGGKRVVYETLGSEEIATASELSYGTRVVPHYHFDKAQMIVSFGADFLGTWGSVVENGKGFAKQRKVGKNAGGKKESSGNASATMSRFVAFESVMTLTGSNADERFRLKSGDEYKAALALAHELVVGMGKSRFAGDSDVRGVLTPYAPAQIAQHLGVPAEAFKATAKNLWENRGKSLVVGGGHNTKGDHGVALEVAVNLLNSALENDGVTVDGTASAGNDRSSFGELTKLVADMKNGQVDALIIYGANPVYSLPKSLGFEEALAKVGTVITCSMSLDETAGASDFVASTHHHTENWGDANPYNGVYGIQQPTISPLYLTRAFEDSLITWAKQLRLSGAVASTPSWHEYLKNYWSSNLHREFGGGKSFGLWWEDVLRGGFIAKARADGRARGFKGSSLGALPRLTWSQGVTLVLYPKISMGDGRNANNGWLQELPDPITKVTWDNYASLSPKQAEAMGVKDGDVLRVRTDLTTIELPAFIQPGMHDQTIAVAVGYGRMGAGRVGNAVGVNVFPFAVGGKQALAMSGLVCNPEKTGKRFGLARTQHHHSMEGRAIVKEASLKEYKHDPKAGNESEGELPTLWPVHEYKGYRWAMAIDLNSCTGCSACVVGCQAENNIPVVGKKFVMSSREMHWLRIDRYYSGRAENPEIVHQPMLCQQCENAPCETVCPVLATMHNEEGLNQQVYNRCVGTRYCANNCPYKVRRFNWFTFTDPNDDNLNMRKPQNLVYNPEVTVRTRGVMEKCTFCMQRIADAKDHAKDEGRPVKDGELKTACQQSCPTDAIVFGNINDKNSRVSQIAGDPRGYHVLEELNVRPSITYLTKIRNTEA